MLTLLTKKLKCNKDQRGEINKKNNGLQKTLKINTKKIQIMRVEKIDAERIRISRQVISNPIKTIMEEEGEKIMIKIAIDKVAETRSVANEMQVEREINRITVMVILEVLEAGDKGRMTTNLIKIGISKARKKMKWMTTRTCLRRRGIQCQIEEVVFHKLRILEMDVKNMNIQMVVVEMGIEKISRGMMISKTTRIPYD